MSRKTIILTVATVVAFLAGNVSAELVSFSLDDGPSSWTPSGAVVSQSVSLNGPVSMTMNAESHSQFTLAVITTNETDYDWTGYILTLDPAQTATFVAGSASSTKFNNVAYADDWTLEYSAPNIVPINEVVTFQFKIMIPDGGPFKFSLTQQSIPEPATLALLACGSALLLRRRKNI